MTMFKAEDWLMHLEPTIAGIPSIFGRLLAVSKLHNEKTGRYEHPDAQEFDFAAVDIALRSLHRKIFVRWLSFRLRQQERDLRVWLAWFGQDGLELLRRTKDIERVIPEQHSEADRELFLSDYKLVRWLVCDLGVARSSPARLVQRSRKFAWIIGGT